MPITVMISLVVTVALFLISLLFRIAARLNLTLPLLYFLAVSTILNPWAATHEKLAFAILYLLTAFSVHTLLYVMSLFYNVFAVIISHISLRIEMNRI